MPVLQGIDSIEDWQRIISPMQQSLQGDDVRYTNLDEEWPDDDPEGIDLWASDSWVGKQLPDITRGDVGDDTLAAAQKSAAADMQQKQFAGIGISGKDFSFPDEPDPGRRMADRRAAARGVNPGRKDGGTGQLFDLARSQLGTPYVFGAAGPSAFDCSGFTQWLYQRVAGITLPHQAKQQATDPRVQRIGRDGLQPGDLLFFSYGRLGPGVISHVEVYMGNGKMIGTANPNEDLDIDNVDWDNFVSGGRVNGVGSGDIGDFGAGGRAGKDPMLKAPKVKEVSRPVDQHPELAPLGLTGEYGEASFSTVLAEILTGDETEQVVKYKMPKFESSGGPEGSIKQQLYRGFMDAGRPDLARMVGTKDFQTWIQQESGWQTHVTSPANNNGMANDGLFQIWRGHDFNSNGQVKRMSPYEQAMLVVKYFDLSPDDIRRYAAGIRSGSYKGWG